VKAELRDVETEHQREMEALLENIPSFSEVCGQNWD
jgi:hypothetical protein